MFGTAQPMVAGFEQQFNRKSGLRCKTSSTKLSLPVGTMTVCCGPWRIVGLSRRSFTNVSAHHRLLSNPFPGERPVLVQRIVVPARIVYDGSWANRQVDCETGVRRPERLRRTGTSTLRP